MQSLAMELMTILAKHRNRSSSLRDLMSECSRNRTAAEITGRMSYLVKRGWVVPLTVDGRRHYQITEDGVARMQQSLQPRPQRRGSGCLLELVWTGVRA